MKFLFLLLFFSTLNPYTLVVMGPSDKSNWFKEATTKVSNVKKHLKEQYKEAILDEKEKYKIFPFGLNSKEELESYYDIYSFEHIALFLTTFIESLHKEYGKINIVCYGAGTIVSSMAIAKLYNKYDEIPKYLTSNITCSSPRSNEILDVIKSSDSEPPEFKEINPKIKLAGKVTIAVCGATVAIVTLIIGPIVAAIISV